MDDKNHVWSDPRRVKHGTDTLVLRQCVSCGRDFAQRFGGQNWEAVSIGAFAVNPLEDATSKEWLEEDCPGRRHADDNIARRMHAK